MLQALWFHPPHIENFLFSYVIEVVSPIYHKKKKFKKWPYLWKNNFFFLSSYPHSAPGNSLNVFFQFWMQGFLGWCPRFPARKIEIFDCPNLLGARPLWGRAHGMSAGGSPGGVAGRAALPWDPPLPSRRGYRLRPIWVGQRGICRGL